MRFSLCVYLKGVDQAGGFPDGLLNVFPLFWCDGRVSCWTLIGH